MAPDLAIAWKARAAFFMRAGKLEACARDAQRSIELDPKLFEGHVLLAQAKERLGDLAAALRSMKTALPLAPNESAAHDVRAYIADLERRPR